MKPHTIEKTPSFGELSQAHASLVVLDTRVNETIAQQTEIHLEITKKNRLHMFTWLLERASQNFGRHFASVDDPLLISHFSLLFKDRGRLFSDISGVSGFPLPPSKMREVPLNKEERRKMPGITDIPGTKKLVGFNDRPSVSVRFLIIYHGPHAHSPDVDGTKEPLVGLFIKDDGVATNTTLTRKRLSNCRIGLLSFDYEDNPVEPDLEVIDHEYYILKLVELCTPQTMFTQVLKYHGPVKMD